MRIALGVEYDGTDYFGWQRQNCVESNEGQGSRKLVTIQERLEDALKEVAAEPIEVICAGRTDAGVHAFEQVVHFDTKAERSDRSWILGANTNLPRDIRVLWARHVSPDFHARFDARSRLYRYVVYGNKVASALLRNRAMWFCHNLDEKLMQEGADFLLGEHDFTSYRGSGCQAKSAKRKMELLKITRNGAMINIDVKANAFLLHMVRNIIGVLLKIGSGEKKPVWAKEVLEAYDRRKAGITAPACGLYLMQVEYPKFED